MMAHHRIRIACLLVGLALPLPARGAGDPSLDPNPPETPEPEPRKARGRLYPLERGITEWDGPISRTGEPPLWTRPPGDRFLGTRDVRKGPVGPRGEGEIGPSTEEDVEAGVGHSELTRWEATKRVLRDLMRAYVTQDASAFMRLFSADFQQDESIFRNAILRDFQQERNPNIDLELLEYRVSFDAILVRMRWSRSAVDAETGLPDPPVSGTCLVRFDRHHGFRLLSWQGPAPFGLDDPQLSQQLAAGQVGPVSAPTIREVSFQLDLGLPVAFLDLDDGSYRVAAGGRPGPSPEPGDDLEFGVFFGKGSNSLVVGHTQSGVDPNVLDLCGAGVNLELFRRVIEDELSNLSVFVSASTPTVLAAVTDEGRYAFVEAFFTEPAAGVLDVTVRWAATSSSTVFLFGEQDCPAPVGGRGGGGGGGGGGFVIGGK